MKKPKDLSPIGNRIFQWLVIENKHESLKKLAPEIGLAPSTLLRNLKNGHDPKLSVLEAISNYFGKQLSETVYGSKNESTAVTKLTNPLFGEIEGWLRERQERLSSDQVAWFRGSIEGKYDDFAEYLKKRQGDCAENGCGEKVSAG